MESIYDSDNHIYTRCKSIDRTALEMKIQLLYNAKNAYICSSGMNALYLTLRSIGEYGAKIIMHPSVPSHASYEIYKKYTSTQSCGVIWFYVTYNGNKINENTYDEILETLCKNNNIRYETSFGKSYYLIERWPQFTDEYIGLRISIGYNEDPLEFYYKLSLLLKEIN